MKPKIRLLCLTSLTTLVLLAGCTSSPHARPGGDTEAAVFFTPRVRDARAAAGHVFPSQHAEYARRDASLGVRTPHANLYPPRRGYQAITRIDETRVLATNQGYRVTERSRTYSTGSTGHRRR
jgi:hypothetical protein